MDDYYAVYYDRAYYIGRVTDHCLCEVVDVPHVKFKFLHKDLAGNSFSWPRRDDIECVHPMWIFYRPVTITGHNPFKVADLFE